MKQLWQQLENHLSAHNPELLADLNPPGYRCPDSRARKDPLCAIASRLCRLPEDSQWAEGQSRLVVRGARVSLNRENSDGLGGIESAA